ncbi:MAG: adenine deaminase, partial [Caldilineae bacterium]
SAFHPDLGAPMSLIEVALNQEPADLLLTNVRLANVITGEVYPADIVVHDGKIAAVEPPGTEPRRQAREVINGQGRLAVPGLVDSHLHIESTLVTPAHFAQAVLPLGVTTVAEDPHEIANVLGVAGIRAMMAASAGIPLKVEYLISSSVPSAPGLERAGGAIGPADVAALLGEPHVLGLAEVMDGAAILAGDPRLRAILEATGGLHGQRVDSPGVIEGHNPMLRGRALNAFIAAGVDSDHTLATPADLVTKARLGVTLQLQERYLSREVITALEALPLDVGVCLVTDDVAPDYLLEAGHLDQVLRRAIALGMDPMRALRAATWGPARRLRLWDRGAITPGRAADVVLTSSIEEFDAALVLADGQVVAEDGRCLWTPPQDDLLMDLTNTVPLARQTPANFRVPAPVMEGEAAVHVIDCVPNTTLVRKGTARLP